MKFANFFMTTRIEVGLYLRPGSLRCHGLGGPHWCNESRPFFFCPDSWLMRIFYRAGQYETWYYRQPIKQRVRFYRIIHQEEQRVQCFPWQTAYYLHYHRRGKRNRSSGWIMCRKTEYPLSCDPSWLCQIQERGSSETEFTNRWPFWCPAGYLERVQSGDDPDSNSCFRGRKTGVSYSGSW